MRWRSDDGAASTLPSFLVAAGVFALAFASVTYFASGYIANQSGKENLDHVASNAATLLAGGSGSPPTWEATNEITDPFPGDLSRLGLLAVGSESTVDQDKATTLHAWGTSTPRYEAAKKALGLEDYEMRLRLYPRFAVDGNAVPALAPHRTAYVGAHTAAGAPHPYASEESAHLDATGAAYVPARVDRDFADGVAAGDFFADSRHEVARNLTPRLAGFVGAEDKRQYTPTDGYWKVVDVASHPCGKEVRDPVVARFLTASACVNGQWKYGSSDQGASLPLRDRILLVDVDFRDLNGANGDTVTVWLTQWVDGYRTVPGQHTDNTDDYGLIEFWCEVGCGAVPRWENTVSRTVRTETGTADAFARTGYDMTTLIGRKGTLALTWRAWDDTVPNIQAELGGQGWFVSKIEVLATRSGAVHTSWTNALDYSSSRYDQIVVGSDTRQSHFTDAGDPVFEDALVAWVGTGGDLLVLGNDDPQDAWLRLLEPDVTASAVGGNMYADKADHLHATLNTPFRLHFTTYTPALGTYDVDDDDVWQWILWNDDSGLKFLSVPRVDGGFEEGVVVLTAFRPYVMGPEGARFMANQLTFQRYRPLEVDYGGTVPPNADVGSASRTVVLDARAFGAGLVEATLVVHVWK